jgi:hypothetical protein
VWWEIRTDKAVKIRSTAALDEELEVELALL